MATHLEIKNNNFILKKDFQLITIQSYKKSLFLIKFKLKMANKNKLFLCIQSLDLFKEKKMSYIKNWLKYKYD